MLKLVKQHTMGNSASPTAHGVRKGWQVKAASWVKKMKHVSRGDVRVGLPVASGGFRVLDSLRPQFMVPDLTGCQLKPYVALFDEAKAKAKAAPAAAKAADSAKAAAAAVEDVKL